MDEKIKKEPDIRFKGFTEPWEQRKVKDLFKITRGYVLATTNTSEKKTCEMPYAVYSSQTKNNGLMGFYKDYLYENAITWTTDGAHAGTVNYRSGKFYCTNVCGVLLANEYQPNQMISEALNVASKNYVSYVGNPKLMNNIMAEIKIMLPLKAEEQSMISNFFQKFDEHITLQQRELDLMKKEKKTLLSKMFPKTGEEFPEIRFKGFTEPWEQRKLEGVVDVRSGRDYKHLSEGTIPVYGTGGYMLSVNKALSYNENAIGIGRKGTIDKPYILKAPFWTVDTLFYAVPRENYDLNFTFDIFQNIDWRKRDESTGVPSLSKTAINGIDVLTPRYNEQEKIGTYFKQLDHLITFQQRQLDQMKIMKKSLLKAMFV